MSENNKIYVTTSSQTISANVKVDNSGYFTEKAQQYAEQSEASAQKSQANVDRLLNNEDFINVSQNLDLIVEAGQKIEGIDLEAILNAEASAKASSESALASAQTSTEQANISTAQATISTQKAIEVSSNVNLANNFASQSLNSSNIAKEQATISTNQATISTTNANNSLTYSCNAKTSEENALKYSNNAKTSETNALTYSNKAKGYLDEVKEIVPNNFTTLPIGSVISVNASANYIPNGFLPCDGSEYSKADFAQLWDNYLTGRTSINLYAFYLDLDNALCLYTTSPTPVSGDEVYELVNGQMVITSHIIAMITDESIVFESSTDGELYTTHRDITKDTSVIISKPLLNTCSYTEYEQDLATYGQCGKFAVKPLGYDGSRLTIVGSPTITENGITSELSQAGYLTIPFIDFKNKSFKYKTRVKFNALNIDRNVIFGQTGADYKFLSLICENQKFRLYTPKDGTAWDVYTVTDFIVQTDTWYDIELISDLTNIVFKVNGETVLTKSWQGITYDIGTNTVCLGTSLNLTAWKFTGSIDLKQFSIIVDGQTVFDCVSGDTFRVPTIKDGAVVQQAMSDGELGKVYNAGLPNVNGTFAGSGLGATFTTTGAFYVGESSSYSYATHNSGTANIQGFGFDASQSNSIYGNSNTVQMNAIALRYFIAVANGMQDDCQATWNTLLELENYLKGV